MLKLIVTSPLFAGEFYITYDMDNVLAAIDFNVAALTPDWIQWIKATIPPVYDPNTFLQYFAKVDFRFIPEDYKVSFEQDFWKHYPKKFNKKLCIPEWDKLSQAEQVSAVTRVKVYLNFCAATGRYVADPIKYIKQKYWLNEWKQ